MDNHTKKRNTKELEKENENQKEQEEVPVEIPIERIVRRIDEENILIKEIPYEIVENYRDAFKEEEMDKRFSSLLEKYDYIVGDVSDEKARLKGFYRNSYNKAPEELRIGQLQDYLLEYCNFGCAYYVLRRSDGKKGILTVNPKQKSRKNVPRNDSKKPKGKRFENKKSGNKKSENKKIETKKQESKKRENKRYEPKKSELKQTETKKQENQKKEFKKPQKTSPKPFLKQNEEEKKSNRSFETKEAKTNERANKPKTDRVETVKDEKGKPRFHIRKNKPEE